MKHYNIPVFIPHLGCPFKCIFCNQQKIASQEKIPDIDDVVKIIEKHLSTIPVNAGEVELAFFGGNFTAIERKLQEEYLSAVNPYIEKGRIDSIRISTRPDFIDLNILTFLEKRGVKTIELGVQSLNDEVLKTSKRGYRAEDVFKACHLIKKQGFRLGIQLMIGLPGDDYSLAKETTNTVISLKPDMVRIYPTLVITGTVLEKMFHRGQYKPLTLQEAITLAKDLFLMFQKEEINVIRMGLQPSEDLQQAGTVIAGPYHPSFGELVEQEIFKQQAKKLIQDYFNTVKTQKSVNLYVHEKDISKMIGSKRSNILYLKNVFNLNNIYLKKATGIKRDWLGVSKINSILPQASSSRLDFIHSCCQN